MSIEFITAMAATGGVIATVIVFIFQSRASTRLQKAEYVYRLNDKYDQICRFRCENPQIMAWAENWTEKPLAEMNPEERAYYHYAGMTLGFFEIAVYSTFVARTLTMNDFREYVRPMMLQEVTYNLPIFKWFAAAGFLAARSKEVLQDLLSEIEGQGEPTRLPSYRTRSVASPRRRTNR